MKKVSLFSCLLTIVFMIGCDVNNSSFKNTKSGLKYKIISGKQGDSVKAGDIVQYSVVQKFGDSLVRNSYEMGNFFAKLDATDQPFSETEVIKMMKLGDSAMIKVSTDSIYKFLVKQNSQSPGFDKVKFDSQVLPFFKKKGSYVTVGVKLIKKYAVDSLAQKDFELEKPKMMAYQEKMQKKQEEEMKKKAEVNKKAGDKFLAENKTKAGVQTTASGLQYTVIKQGTGAVPKLTDNVKVHYVGTFIDGKEFESSVKNGQPADFNVTEVVTGWTEILQVMPVGSKYKVFIPAELGYKDMGKGTIEGGTTLIFEMELLAINPPQANKPAAGQQQMDPRMLEQLKKQMSEKGHDDSKPH